MYHFKSQQDMHLTGHMSLFNKDKGLDHFI